MGTVLGKAHRCQHSQGQVSRQEQVECCGGKLNLVEIYVCDIHGECAGDKASWNRLRANSIRVKACHNCCDFTVLPTLRNAIPAPSVNLLQSLVTSLAGAVLDWIALQVNRNTPGVGHDLVKFDFT